MTPNRTPSFQMNSRLHIFGEVVALADHLGYSCQYEDVTPASQLSRSLWFHVQLRGVGEALVGIPEGSEVTGYTPRASRVREFLAAFVNNDSPAFTVLDFGEWQPPEDSSPHEIRFWREQHQLPFHFLFLSLQPTVDVGERLSSLVTKYIVQPMVKEIVLVAQERCTNALRLQDTAIVSSGLHSEVEFKNIFSIEGDLERRYFEMKEDEMGYVITQQGLTEGEERGLSVPAVALPIKIVLEPLQLPLEDYLALQDGDEIELGGLGKVPGTLFTGGIATARGYLTMQNERCIFRISDCEEIFAFGGNKSRKISIHQVDSPFQEGGQDDE